MFVGVSEPADEPEAAPGGPQATPHLSVTDARPIAERALGTPVEELVPQAGSVGNQNFRLDTVRGRFALKLAAESELAAERCGLEQAAGAGVPVPRINAAGPLTGRRGFLITEWLDGLPANAETDTEALTEAGRALRRFHHVTGPGYGRVDVAAGAAYGQHVSWAAFIDSILGGIADLVRHRVVSAAFAHRLEGAVAAHRELIDYRGTGVLLHCDLKPDHVLVEAGRLAAIIDWGDTSYGDPWWDLARLRHAGNAVLAPVLDGYRSEDRQLNHAGLGPALLEGGVGPGSVFDRTTACLSALHRLDALHYELMAGGDWFDTYRATITDWLDSLSPLTP